MSGHGEAVNHEGSTIHTGSEVRKVRKQTLADMLVQKFATKAVEY